MCLLHLNSLLLSGRWIKRFFCNESTCNVSGILNFPLLLLFIYPFFIGQNRSFIIVLVVLLSFSVTFISSTWSHLTIPWASLSAMGSNYCTLQSCLGTKLMLFDMVDDSCSMLVLNSPSSQRGIKSRGVEDVFQIWLWRAYIPFWFRVSNHFIVGIQQVKNCGLSIEDKAVSNNL